MRKKIDLNSYSVGGLVLAISVLVGCGCYTSVFAQTNEEKDVDDVLRQNATAFANNDMATMKKIGVRDELINNL